MGTMSAGWRRGSFGVLLLVGVIVARVPAEAAVGTAFTYQGRIAQTGTAVTGLLDFEFQLYDAALVGSPVGAAIPLADVSCSNGLFTVTLDFGAAAFNGDQRWLEIRVSPDISSTAYTTLIPRQEMTPTPYAIFSTDAANAVTATNAVNATSADDSDLLDGIDSTGFSLVGHVHAAGTITGVADGLVVYGSGGGTALTGEAGFAYDATGNDLTVANDMNVGGVYRIGTNAVLRVAPAADNTFAGLAGNAGATGTANSALGDGALVAVTAGKDNTALGRSALAALLVDDGNTAVGANALAANAGVAGPNSGDNNTAMGASALALNTTGFANTAVGISAMTSNTTGYANVAVGAGSLGGGTAGTYNTAVGVQALAASSLTGSGQTAVGFQALAKATVAVNNTAVGTNALAANVTGNANTAVGVNALTKATVEDNVAVGDSALGNTTTGNRNSALGTKSLFANVIGADNTAMGALAAQNTNAGQNTAIGASALLANVNGTSNTAVGAYALDATTTSGNTGLGDNALGSLTSGGNNTAVGAQAGQSLQTGAANILIGYGAGGALATNETYNIMIGNSGTAGDGATIRIGTAGNQSFTFVAGISGTALVGTPVVVTASGQLGVIVSSLRFKEAVRDMGASADQLLALRPVVFRYRADVTSEGDPRTEQFGLIAEEVGAVNPDWVVYDAAGNVLSVRYDQVNAALLGLVQRQQAKIDALEAQMSGLAARLARLEGAGSR